MPDDAALLRRYSNDRAEDAFAELVRRHIDGVYSTALRRVGGDTHLAQDVTQQVFVALARKAAELSRHPVLTGWLYLTTRHESANVVRSEQRRKAREYEAHMNENQSPFDSIDWSRLAPVIDGAIDELPDTDRHAVLLRFIDRRGFAEIGAILNLSEDAARMRHDRALDKLRGLLARRGITSTSAALGLALSSHAVAAAPATAAAKVATAALAGNAGASSAMAVGGVFELMTITKINLSAIAALALFAALGVSFHEWRDHHSAERELISAQQELARSTRRNRDTERSAQTAEQNLATLQTELASARESAARAEAARLATEIAARWDPDQEGRAFVERHPEVKQALLQYGSARQRFMYAPLYRELKLTAGQIDEWEKLLMGGSMGHVKPDGKVVALPVGEPPDSALGKYGQQRKAIVGEEGYSKLGEFDLIAQARGVAADVASSLYFTDTPLSSEQVDQLVSLLTQHRRTGPAAKVSNYDWTALIEKSSAVLSPSQLAVLSGKRAADLFQKALNRPRTETGALVSPPSAVAGEK